MGLLADGWWRLSRFRVLKKKFIGKNIEEDN